MNRLELKNKLDAWVVELRYDEKSKNTINDYKHGVELFINFIKNDSFLIDKNLMLDYKDFLKQKYKVSSCNKYIVEINKFIYWCGYPNCTLKKIKTQKKSSLNNPLEEQEHKRMLRWARKLNMEDMYLIIESFAHAGIRVAELKYFTVENITKSPYIDVYNKGKERTVILVNDLRRNLINYCKRNNIESGYIFISPRNPNKLLCSSTIWRRLKRIARAAKINPDKIHAHSWRHLFAKNAKDAGIDLDELQDIFGHNNIETTAIYTMTSNKEKKEKLEKIKYGGRK